jgi:hypothetical protein
MGENKRIGRKEGKGAGDAKARRVRKWMIAGRGG